MDFEPGEHKLLQYLYELASKTRLNHNQDSPKYGVIKFHLIKDLVFLYSPRRDLTATQGNKPYKVDDYFAPKEINIESPGITPEDALRILQKQPKVLEGLEVIYLPEHDDILNYEELFNQVKSLKQPGRLKDELDKAYQKLNCELRIPADTQSYIYRNHVRSITTTIDMTEGEIKRAEETMKNWRLAEKKRTEIAEINVQLGFKSITTPVVYFGDKEYTFKPMQIDGVPYRIISYCLEKHPGEVIGLDDLKKELKQVGTPIHGVDNLTEAMRKNSLFGTNKDGVDGPLRVFLTTLNPKYIELTKSVSVSELQLQKIIDTA